MAALITYTTYAAVRAILGVGAKEITDTALALPHLAVQFELEMSDVDSDVGAVLTQFTTITAIDAAARTAAQTRLFNIVGLIAGYSVARQLLASAAMFAPKTIEDGAARIDRVADPFKSLREGVMAGYSTLRTRLAAALLVLVPAADIAAAESRSYMVSTGLGTDPVLNT